MTDAHALVVGISRYAHVPSLPPTSDAVDVAAVLADPAAGRMPAANVRLLVDGAATRAAILEGLAHLARVAGAASTVVVYFSGHGAADVIVPADAVRKQPATMIGHAELARALAAIPAARLTVILDACRSGSLVDVAPVGDPAAALARGRGRVVIAAADEVARVETGARNSELTTHLLAGLRGAAADAGGAVRVSDLFHYVAQQLAARPGAQRPVFRGELSEDYPLAQLATGAPAVPPLAAHAAADGHDRYDYAAFLSHAPDDAAWAERTAAVALERAGLRTCLARRDFELGRPRLAELERAVDRSRYTVAVFSPAYLASAQRDDWRLAGEGRLIALLRQPCALPAHARLAPPIDATGDDHAAAFAELAARLRQPLPLPPR